MRDFKELQRFIIRGRTVIATRMDRDETRTGLLERLQAEGVSIDGVPVQIDAVETFAIEHQREGIEIGLRLVEVPQEGQQK
jgi:hypothetical protein